MLSPQVAADMGAAERPVVATAGAAGREVVATAAVYRAVQAEEAVLVVAARAEA